MNSLINADALWPPKSAPITNPFKNPHVHNTTRQMIDSRYQLGKMDSIYQLFKRRISNRKSKVIILILKTDY